MWLLMLKSFKTNGIFHKVWYSYQVKSGWSIIYIEGSKVIFSKKCTSFSAAADPDEMSHIVAFHLGLHCLTSEEPVLWFLVNRTMLNFRILCLI